METKKKNRFVKGNNSRTVKKHHQNSNSNSILVGLSIVYKIKNILVKQTLIRKRKRKSQEFVYLLKGITLEGKSDVTKIQTRYLLFLY